MLEVRNLRTDAKQLILDWQDIEEGVKALLPKLPFRPQVVLGLARGGTIPASLIHRYYPKAKFETVRLISYNDRQAMNQIHIEHCCLNHLKGKKILVVDDILDSGRSIDTIVKRLRRVPNVSVTCAVLVSKQLTALPVVSAFSIEYDTWVTFPWERLGKK